MRSELLNASLACALGLLLTGCLNLQLGGGSSKRSQPPTVGQQLIDLQRARESGAINDAEYQSARTKLLNQP
jgi:hypothetical protein